MEVKPTDEERERRGVPPGPGNGQENMCQGDTANKTTNKDNLKTLIFRAS